MSVELSIFFIAKPKPKKPRVPPAKPAVKKAAKKPAVKKAAKKLKGETKKKTKPAEEEIKNEPVAEIQPEKVCYIKGLFLYYGFSPLPIYILVYFSILHLPCNLFKRKRFI